MAALAYKNVMHLIRSLLIIVAFFTISLNGDSEARDSANLKGDFKQDHANFVPIEIHLDQNGHPIKNSNSPLDEIMDGYKPKNEETVPFMTDQKLPQMGDVSQSENSFSSISLDGQSEESLNNNGNQMIADYSDFESGDSSTSYEFPTDESPIIDNGWSNENTFSNDGSYECSSYDEGNSYEVNGYKGSSYDGNSFDSSFDGNSYERSGFEINNYDVSNNGLSYSDSSDESFYGQLYEKSSSGDDGFEINEFEPKSEAGSLSDPGPDYSDNGNNWSLAGFDDESQDGVYSIGGRDWSSDGNDHSWDNYDGDFVDDPLQFIVPYRDRPSSDERQVINLADPSDIPFSPMNHRHRGHHHHKDHHHGHHHGNHHHGNHHHGHHHGHSHHGNHHHRHSDYSIAGIENMGGSGQSNGGNQQADPPAVVPFYPQQQQYNQNGQFGVAGQNQGFAPYSGSGAASSSGSSNSSGSSSSSRTTSSSSTSSNSSSLKTQGKSSDLGINQMAEDGESSHFIKGSTIQIAIFAGMIIPLALMWI